MPTIDCNIVVDTSQVAAAAQVLIGIGFRPLGELGISQRWAFKEPPRLAGTNTYVTASGSLSLKNHLGVRGTRCEPVPSYVTATPRSRSSLARQPVT
jgi:hypothetical protein